VYHELPGSGTHQRDMTDSFTSHPFYKLCA